MSVDETPGRFDVIKWFMVFALIAISIVGNEVTIQISRYFIGFLQLSY